MKLAFLYAGQGSQKVGMGIDLYQAEPNFRATFDLLCPELRNICFYGPAEALSQTENTQPCMVAFAAGITAVFRANGIMPKMAAGLSLGEYSALHVAGVFDTKTAIDLVQFRGNQMAMATQNISSAMVAVLQLERKQLQQCCQQSASYGIVEVANYNCPGQVVLSGEAKAVEYAAKLALKLGARSCIPLAVSGAFHTSLMKPAGDALREKFKEITFGSQSFPVIFNSTAKPLAADETVAHLLEQQVQSSVYFEDTIRFMETQGIDTIIEIGPGKTLSGFVRKTSRKMRVLSVEDTATLAAALNELKGDYYE